MSLGTPMFTFLWGCRSDFFFCSLKKSGAHKFVIAFFIATLGSGKERNILRASSCINSQGAQHFCWTVLWLHLVRCHDSGSHSSCHCNKVIAADSTSKHSWKERMLSSDDITVVGRSLVLMLRAVCQSAVTISYSGDWGYTVTICFTAD